MTTRAPSSASAHDARPDQGARGAGRSARRRARELALQGLYQWLIGGQALAAIEGHLKETDGFGRADAVHLHEVLRGTIEGADDLRAEFGRYIDRAVAELSPVEHAILLIGSYELKHRAEIPYRVVINEAVELAKSFGGTEGFKYVNGVLDKLAAQLRPVEVEKQSGVGSRESGVGGRQ